MTALLTVLLVLVVCSAVERRARAPIAIDLAVPGVPRGSAPRFRRRARLAEQDTAHALAGALDELSRRLRSGAALADALADAHDATVVGRLGASLRAGRTLGDALEAEATTQAPDVLVVAALGFVGSHGGPAALVVDGIGRSVRERDRARRELAALLAPARASAVIVSLAPLALLGLVAVADRSVIVDACSRPVGVASLGLGLACELGGVLWMRRIADALGGGR